MAIVFVSPKEKQKVFLAGIIALVVLVMAVVAAIIILPSLINSNQNSPVGKTPVAPALVINLSVIDSAQVSSLQPFTTVQTEFTYVVKDKKGKQINGNISATSQQEAQSLLEASGFSVVSVSLTQAGNSEPFTLPITTQSTKTAK